MFLLYSDLSYQEQAKNIRDMIWLNTNMPQNALKWA